MGVSSPQHAGNNSSEDLSLPKTQPSSAFAYFLGLICDIELPGFPERAYAFHYRFLRGTPSAKNR